MGRTWARLCLTLWGYQAAARTPHLPLDPQAQRPSFCPQAHPVPRHQPYPPLYLPHPPVSPSQALGSAGPGCPPPAILPLPLLPSVSVALRAGDSGQGGRQAGGSCPPLPLRWPAPGPGPTETTGGGSIESGTGRLAGPDSVLGGPRSSCPSSNSCQRPRRRWAGARQADTRPGGAGVAVGSGPRLWLPGLPSGWGRLGPTKGPGYTRPCSGYWEGPREGASGWFLFQGWEGEPWHQASAWDTGSSEGQSQARPAFYTCGCISAG